MWLEVFLFCVNQRSLREKNSGPQNTQINADRFLCGIDLPLLKSFCVNLRLLRKRFFSTACCLISRQSFG